MKRLQMLKGLHTLEKRDEGGTKSLHTLEERDEDGTKSLHTLEKRDEGETKSLHSLEKRDEGEMKKGLWSSQQHASENNMPLTQGGEEKERGWHS